MHGRDFLELDRITGKHYQDVVALYALARAGYIPQVFSLVMATQGGTMINDLLKICNGKALVYDEYYQEHISKIGYPSLMVLGLLPFATLQAQEHLVGLPVVEDDNVAVIFHTSGTTSGRPKPVPQSHKWLRYQWEVSWRYAWQGEGPEQKVFSNIGSFANVASATRTSIAQTGRTRKLINCCSAQQSDTIRRLHHTDI